MSKATYQWLDKQASMKRFYAELQRDNEVCQITVTNHTPEIRQVCLWGALGKTKLTDQLTFKKAISKNIILGKNLIDSVFNTASQTYFILDEGDDMLFEVDLSGQLIQQVDLNTNANIDIQGPVKITYNSNVNHPNYGDMIIACKRADQVLILDKIGKVKDVIDVGIEPVDVVFNIYNNRFYVANSKSEYLTMLDQSYQSYQLNGFVSPVKITANSSNGDLLVFDNGNKTLTNLDESGKFGNLILGVASSRPSLIYLEETNEYCFTSFESGEILVINAASLNTNFKIKNVLAPFEISVDIKSGIIRLLDDETQSLISFNSKFDEIGRQQAEGITHYNLNGTLSIYIQSSENRLLIIGAVNSPTVTVNEEYYEDRQDFQYNPAMVGHVKLVASGEDRINALQIIEKSVTGTEICKTISLSNSQSPQNFANVSEVFDFDGNLIDGHVTWCFKINPLQQVTFLIYYNQIEMYNMLPEKSRISTGVQMSKGIPVSWLDNPNNAPPDESTY